MQRNDAVNLIWGGGEMYSWEELCRGQHLEKYA